MQAALAAGSILADKRPEAGFICSRITDLQADTLLVFVDSGLPKPGGDQLFFLQEKRWLTRRTGGGRSGNPAAPVGFQARQGSPPPGLLYTAASSTALFTHDFYHGADRCGVPSKFIYP